MEWAASREHKRGERDGRGRDRQRQGGGYRETDSYNEPMKFFREPESHRGRRNLIWG